LLKKQHRGVKYARCTYR